MSTNTFGALLGLVVAATTGVSAIGQTVQFAHPPMAGGGTPRQSQLWVDPAGENDSDNDAICWAPFTLTQSASISRLRWWGEPIPAHGFRVSFYNQDPNTIASQPDIFAPGSGPISQTVFATPAMQSDSGLTLYTVDLSTPLTLEGGTRYFVSVVALQDAWYDPWNWAQGMDAGSTFWWQRGAHMFFNIAGNRAFELIGTPITPPACPGDITGASGAPDGSVDVQDLNAILSAFSESVPLGDPRDLANGDGVINVEDLNILLANYGCG